MKKVNDEILLNIIKNDKLTYFSEYKIILEEEHDLYTNDEENAFVILQNYSYGSLISVINFNAKLLSEAIAFTGKPRDEISIVIPLKSDEKLHTENNSNLNLSQKAVYKSFAYNGSVLPHSSNKHIRLLDKNDLSLVNDFPEENHKNMLQLPDAFSEFVLNENGEIIGYFADDGSLAGYLSCCPEIDNIWDVVYIYVSPENRSRGIGTALAAQYLNSKGTRGQIPYYSGVTNPSSEAAALQAGFSLCGLRYYFS